MSTRLIVGLCTGFALAGCESDPADQMSAANAAGAGASDESARCPPDTEEFRFGANGLVQTDVATGITVRLLKANAAPPIRGFNDWTIGVTDPNGAAMPQAELNWACAWMPAHSHGSAPKSVVRLGSGQFELARQNLAMYGGWQIKLWIAASGGPAFEPQGGSGILSGDVCKGSGSAPNIQFNICVPTSPDE